jgi:hypothetical protein
MTFLSRRSLAVALAGVCILMGTFFLIADHLYIRMPKDKTVLRDFETHMATFERMRQMAAEDSNLASEFAADDLNKDLKPERRDEYQGLFAQLPTGIIVTTHRGSVRFVLATRGLLSTGPECIKGIEYLPSVPAEWGKLVDNLNDPGALAGRNVYLRPIQGKWFIFLQKE